MAESTIVKLVREAFAGRDRKSSGEYDNYDCVHCSDTRGRGGIRFDEDGMGFSYHCFNGGCLFENSLNWRIEFGLTKRLRVLLDDLGVDISGIPIDERRARGALTKKDAYFINSFPRMELPQPVFHLFDAAGREPVAYEGYAWLYNRSPMFLEVDYPILWSPSMPDYVILPFIHFGEVVGYTARRFRGDGIRFIRRGGQKYLFRQDLVFKNPYRYLLVVESPFDALLLRGVATMSNTVNRYQAAALKVFRGNVVMVPDYEDGEYRSYLNCAASNRWAVSVPEWTYKDAGEAIRENGLLYTIEKLVDSSTTLYPKAKAVIRKMVEKRKRIHVGSAT